MLVRELRPRPHSWSQYKENCMPIALPFRALEWSLQWSAYYLSRWALLEVLEYLSVLSVLFAVIFYFTESGDRQKQKHYPAWQLVNTAQGKGGSGGRIEALQELNPDHVPLVGVNAAGAFLQGIQLQGAKLEGADLYDAGLVNAGLRGAHLSGTNLQNADLRNVNLQGPVEGYQEDRKRQHSRSAQRAGRFRHLGNSAPRHIGRRVAPPHPPAELHIRKHLWNMRVVMPVPIPGPTGAGLQLTSRTVELLEPRTVDPPHIPVARRQRAPIRQPAQSLPRQRHLNGPARRLHMHRMPQPRKIPVRKTPALAARMHVPPHPVQNHGSLRRRIELRTPIIWTARRQRILPDPEHPVDRIQRVDLEFVIRVLTGDEDFHIVVFVNARIALGQIPAHLRLFSRETEVQALVVPQQRHARIEPRRFAGHDIGERLGFRRHAPGWLVQLAVDPDRPRRPVARVMRQVVPHSYFLT